MQSFLQPTKRTFTFPISVNELACKRNDCRAAKYGDVVDEECLLFD